ncbi:UNVERIFIED_CONTAM: hypothetical protein Sradi_1904300 [Sesamum radiatum]|uniref:Uncharacterized protein n=1 Tax=Sesamum radiatum TaxID=300843 RepID=A0AAW2TYV4_SESRA
MGPRLWLADGSKSRGENAFPNGTLASMASSGSMETGLAQKSTPPGGGSMKVINALSTPARGEAGTAVMKEIAGENPPYLCISSKKRLCG